MILNDLRSIRMICYLTVNFEVASYYGTLPPVVCGETSICVVYGLYMVMIWVGWRLKLEPFPLSWYIYEA